jgi:hypothetical protein
VQRDTHLTTPLKLENNIGRGTPKKQILQNYLLVGGLITIFGVRAHKCTEAESLLARGSDLNKPNHIWSISTTQSNLLAKE